MNTLKKTLRLAAAITGIALSACGGGSSSNGNSGGNSIGWNATPDWTRPSGNPGNSGSSGGSTATPTGDNTVPVRVAGTTGSVNGLNRLLVSIKVCVPGTTTSAQCVTVDNMLVDTGSTGVRIAARAIPTLAPLLLTQAGAVDDKVGSAPIAECAPFASGYTWGSVKRADIAIGSKTASNLPIQLISDGAFATPADCIAHNGGDMGAHFDTLGANGILGIDNFTGDSLDALNTAVPGLYYYCPSQNNCISTRMLASKEITNPVAAFATDNNGTIIRLPTVPATGQASVTGQLVFGVGTQPNNALPATATVVAVDKYGTFTTQYNGLVFNRSALDTGTSSYAFPDVAIPFSSDTGLYTPASTLNLNATLEPNNGTSPPLQMPFSIDNGTNLLASGNAAFNNLGQSFSNSRNNMFLWGLPFFFGRDVYTVIANAKIGARTGPFVAF